MKLYRSALSSLNLGYFKASRKRKALSTGSATLALGLSLFIFTGAGDKSLLDQSSATAIETAASVEQAAPMAPRSLSRQRKDFDKALGMLADAAASDQKLAEYHKRVQKRVTGEAFIPEQGSGVRVVMFVLLLPLLLIALNTIFSTLLTAGSVEESGWVDALVFIGQTPIALLITLLFATYTLGTRGRSLAQTETILNDALAPICAIILITGAGGMFGGVLRHSGIGAALSDSLADLGLPLILSAFVIATLLRVAQGSATVALVTTAGLISTAAAAADLSSVDLVSLVLAIAAGATVLSHVNDSGFWLVSRFFGMDVKTTLRTWTVMETTLGLSIFALALALWYLPL